MGVDDLVFSTVIGEDCLYVRHQAYQLQVGDEDADTQRTLDQVADQGRGAIYGSVR